MSNTIDTLGDRGCLKKIVENTIEEYIDDKLTSLRQRAFFSISSLKTIDLPNLTSVGEEAFSYTGITSLYLPSLKGSLSTTICSGCSSLTEIDLPGVTYCNAQYAFYNLAALETVRLDNCVSMECGSSYGTCSFYNDYKLKNVYVPKLKTLGNALFNSCSSLKELDLPSATYLGTQIFSGCASLKALILRNTEGCCEYKETGSTYDPPNADLKIYVPSALIESYKEATNWSRLADKFVALEDYTVDGTTTGAMNKDSDGNIIART